jgi:hypothetical protein
MREYVRSVAASAPSDHRRRQSAGSIPGELAASIPDGLAALYRSFLDAADRNDTATLTRTAWALFTKASVAREAWCDTADLLAELRAAAQAAAAGQGSPASLGPLRHVLAGHGWLPPSGGTPLQVLAARPENIRALQARSLQDCYLGRHRIRGTGIAEGGACVAQQGERPSFVERGSHAVKDA